MLTLLRTPRWLGFTSLVIAAIVGFGLLSQWQFTRAEERRSQRTAIELATASTVATVAEAMSATAFTGVDLEGEFLPATVLVRNRPLEGGNGYWVVSPWRETSSKSEIWVVRGWMPTTGGATEVVTAPEPPTGIGTLQGITREFEDSGPRPDDLPPGQVQAVSLEQLGNPESALWVQSTTVEPPLIPVPIPAIDEGRNISYAWQWLLFSAIASGGWFIFLRREARLVESSERERH